MVLRGPWKAPAAAAAAAAVIDASEELTMIAWVANHVQNGKKWRQLVKQATATKKQGRPMHDDGDGSGILDGQNAWNDTRVNEHMPGR